MKEIRNSIQKIHPELQELEELESAAIAEKSIKFMMHIEDVFALTGRGAAITGRVMTGSLAVGDMADLVFDDGGTIPTSIKKIEVYKGTLERADAGDSIGVILEGVQKEDIIGAIALVNRNAWAVHKKFIANIHVLGRDEGGVGEPIFSGYYPYFFFETAELRGMMDFDNKKQDMMLPKDDGNVNVELEDYAIIAPGMTFVMHEGRERRVAKGKIIGLL